MIAMKHVTRNARHVSVSQEACIYLCLCMVTLVSCTIGGNSLRPDPNIALPSEAQQVDQALAPNIISFTTNRSPDQVLDWYKQEMLAEGWTVNLEVRKPTRSIISFTSAGYRMLFSLMWVQANKQMGEPRYAWS